MNAQRAIARKLAGVLAVAVVALCGHAAMGQSGPLKIVVPFPPGGSADILARLVADQLGRAQGVSTVIENRPGAGTIVATEAVSHATPDGNTLLINANSFIINPNLRQLAYDPFTDFEPVCYLVRSPQVIVVNTTSPYHTLKDLLEAARAKPGDVTMASVGPATTQHIAIAMLEHAAQVNLTYIPYPGGAPAVNALLGELPDVPTVAESGYKDYEAEVWFGLVAPAKTPAETIARLAGWLVAALQVPDIKSKLMTLGLYPVGTCGAAYGAHIRQQYDAYARAIKESNIKGE